MAAEAPQIPIKIEGMPVLGSVDTPVFGSCWPPLEVFPVLSVAKPKAEPVGAGVIVGFKIAEEVACSICCMGLLN